ncbi:hypothetical protein PF010_g11774 [Phytophthora fragariae]|nr:hypothetical protein PF011_g11652 [Phytophthora fragariae]KAE9108795.1 hypothetical protein PF010_g11774 [Phytophthora fragariae]KAE9245886.1 hypothetical protein PF002_g7012 [Phytophthora fragariae]
MTLNSVQEDVVEEEQEGKDDGTPLDAKADGHVVSSPAQHRDAADQVEPPRGLSPYVAVLRERKEGDAQIALHMASRSVSPQRVVCLLDFVSQINTSLVRLWCVVCLHSSCCRAHHVLILAFCLRVWLGPEGARLLGSALVTNNTLQVLELDACDLVGSAYRPQHEGILALSKGLQSVRSRLRFVNVACNDLQPQGCRILLGALSFHKTLTRYLRQYAGALQRQAGLLGTVLLAAVQQTALLVEYQ